MEVDHIQPRSQGGKDEYKNLQLLHRHCHDEKTALDEREAVSMTTEQLDQEPCEAKVSRTVLNGRGRR
jgi:5-methylcytosine-specific restriction endonuclease McrA